MRAFEAAALVPTVRGALPDLPNITEELLGQMQERSVEAVGLFLAQYPRDDDASVFQGFYDQHSGFITERYGLGDSVSETSRL
mmetsp:Transcript_5222/g.9071  ORF Transcript_5222/g.9071 Transcript_5222/m.9071 type:complete len:83 (+) Transcript_5222:2917-3165(+)